MTVDQDFEERKLNAWAGFFRLQSTDYHVFVLCVMFGWNKKPFDAMDPALA